jgi:hypothetical protein
MKKLLILPLIFLAVFSCKKTKFSPEGPTDVRVRNLSDVTFSEVVVSTSENETDKASFGDIMTGSVSEYFRFTKAYPKAEISAKIDVGGSAVEFSTGSVDYTYLNYIGRDRITFEVYISDFNNRKLTISNVILEEALVMK